MERLYTFAQERTALLERITNGLQKDDRCVAQARGERPWLTQILCPGPVTSYLLPKYGRLLHIIVCGILNMCQRSYFVIPLRDKGHMSIG